MRLKLTFLFNNTCDVDATMTQPQIIEEQEHIVLKQFEGVTKNVGGNTLYNVNN